MKAFKRTLTLLLCLAMIVVYMPMTAFAESEEPGDQLVAAQEEPAPAAVDSASEAEEPAPAAEEPAPAAEEPAPATEEPVAEEAEASEEAAPSAEEAAEADDPEAKPEDTAEADDPEKKDAEDAAKEKDEEKDEEEPEEEKVYEDGQLVYEGKGFTVALTYSAEAMIPVGAGLKVNEIKGGGYDEYLVKTEDKLDQTVPYARFFDITIVDEEGNEMEPSDDVNVVITLNDDPASEPGVKFSAVHFTDEKVDKIPVSVDGSFEFTADSFSVYGIAYTYTVDFYYDAAGNGDAVKYSLEGGSQMLLSELFAALGIDESVNNINTITSEGLDGTEVPFGDRVRFARHLYNNDWTITSLEPFDDWYKVTVKMLDGTEYVITVTDPPATDQTTVSHIDIGITAAASIKIPLAYGHYYDENGSEVLFVDIGETADATGVNEQVPITSDDIRNADITATRGGSPFTNFTVGPNYDTSWGTDPNTGATIDQVRAGGRYPTGTLANPVIYSVEVDKDVELTLEYDGKTLYTADGEPLTVTVKAALVSSFTYFDANNMCPGIMNHSNVNGNVDTFSDAGMDFILGTSSDTDTSVTAIEIIKYIVDEEGNNISTDAEYDFDFDVYQNTSGDVNAPTAWEGETTASVDYSGYSKLNDRQVTTSTDGLGVVYDYDVADTALVYVVEDDSTIPQEIKDADGNTLKYKETYIETEYTWRTDGDESKKHSNKQQDDTYKAIPDVVGDYGNLHNTFLEFRVYNVYCPDKTTFKVTKEWDDDDDNDGLRPDSVSVQLLADGEAYGDAATLNEGNEWAYTWEDLPGDKEYTVEEPTLPEGYTAEVGEVSGDAEKGYEVTITNTHEPEETEATIKKVWDDDEDAEGARPESITMTLSNGIEVTLDESKGWAVTVSGLPKYKDGKEIEYTWTEEEVEGYELTDSSVDGTVTTITNTYEPEEDPDDPDDPEDPEKPDKPGKPSKGVDTGDSNNPFAALMVFLVAAAGLGGVYVYKKRRDEK